MTKQKEPSPGALLAAQRRQVEHTCAVCGEKFMGITTRRQDPARVFCSNKCKQRDKYQRAKLRREESKAKR